MTSWKRGPVPVPVRVRPVRVQRFVKEQRQRELSPVKDNGYFDLLPREVIVHILSYLDLSSLVRVSAVSSTFRWLSHDPWLYTRLDLRLSR